MNVLTFDVETTHTEKRGGGYSPLPYFGNRLVSIGYKWLVSSVDYDCYYHSTEPPTQAAAEKFQLSLDHADVLVGHNIKFDLTWIRECGFTYEGHIYDTMVAEYILSKARRWPLGVAALAKKYDVPQKEPALVEPYIKEEIALKQLDAFGVTFRELFHEPRADIEAVTGDDKRAYAD